MNNNFTTAAYGLGFSSYLLTKSDLSKFLDLQKEVIDGFPLEKKHLLKPRTLEDLTAHLDAGMDIIGVQDYNGKHIAHILLTDINSPAAKNVNAYPLQEKMAAIQSLAIQANYRPTKYINEMDMIKPDQLLFAQAEALAQWRGFEKIIAKVSTTNKGSTDLFEKHGFKISKTAKLNNDTYTSHFLEYKLSDPKPLLKTSPTPSIGVELIQALA